MAKQPQPIEPFLDDLKSSDYKMRSKAVKGLRNSRNPDALPYLIEAANDKTVAVRIHAIRGLGSSKNPLAIKPLIQQLKHSACNVHRRAHEEILTYGITAVPALIEALKDKNKYVRGNSAICLMYIPHSVPDAIEPLIQCLQDTDAHVIFHAAHALGFLNAAPAKEPLWSLVCKDDRQLPSGDGIFPAMLRSQAARACQDLGDERATAPLLKLFTERVKSQYISSSPNYRKTNPKLADEHTVNAEELACAINKLLGELSSLIRIPDEDHIKLDVIPSLTSIKCGRIM